MAPIDRREHRLQRIRGAGTNAVQAKFAFNLGGAPLPPQRSSRRTPQPRQASLPPSSARKTPGTATRRTTGSAQRHRSASVQRSSTSKPLQQIRELVTPKLGKRKRGSTHAQSANDDDDGSLDELSPENDTHARSVEKSRRAPATASPILEEEEDEGPDELSVFGADTAMSSTRKTAHTPIALESTPIARASGSASVAALAQDEEGSEDELSPPRTAATTSRKLPKQPESPPPPALPSDDDLDEISPIQPTVVEADRLPTATPSTRKVSTREKAQRMVEDDEDEEEEDELQTTPATNNRRRTVQTEPPRPADVSDNEDELSPERQQTKQSLKRKTHKVDGREDERPQEPSLRSTQNKQKPNRPAQKDPESGASAEEASEDEEDEADPIARTRKTRPKAPRKERPTQPPKKRQKRNGAVDIINVMRLKGLSKGVAIRGVTVADTTRTIAQDIIETEVQRQNQTLERTQHPGQRRAIKGQANAILAFNERFEDWMLDLQDANDSGSRYLNKLKEIKQNNGAMRRDILRMQRDRQEVALEYDEVVHGHKRQKNEYESRQKLSTTMFDIEAAIQRGKQRARAEGREDEGPEMPLRMLLGHVSRGVGSTHGGLLSYVRKFNGVLERAAGFLEGRA
ncbi:hypothetical protein P154DRAFT_192141 [Amniculicola lignicola CBS 123094]|uniref:Inner kinetochore subunit AME1 domain-containing protein n=1 Tax=Amniculicola lignicola CBS 123094 TaxID=1392246 RepID=A0A6A5WGS3_9PLEO|nr:hypothetical protein P154DRAFT_192141 [Amniculicola lignicola CBS 123094]